MGISKWRRLIVISSAVLLIVICTAASTYAALPAKTLTLPKGLESFAPQKMIFSADGSKAVLLVQEADPAKARAQMILLYDITKNEWGLLVGILDGGIWELEPLALNERGTMLAYRKRDSLFVMKTDTAQNIYQLEEVGSMTRAAFSPGDFYLAYLNKAEWEEPTNLALLELGSQVKKSKKGVPVKGNVKIAGPLAWNPKGEVYYIEEFAYGTVNSVGIVRKYNLEKSTLTEIYNSKSDILRVTNFALSPNGEYLAMILCEFGESYTQRRYGLLVQKNGQFVYGTTFDEWVDITENWTTSQLSTLGWIGDDQLYWVTRSGGNSNLSVYNLGEGKLSENQYSGQVYVSPKGVVLLVEK